MKNQNGNRDSNPLIQKLIASVSGQDFKPTVILLSSCILMLIWRYFGSVQFYDSLRASHPDLVIGGDYGLTRAVYMFGSAALLLGVIPILIVRFVFRESLSSYGVTLGDRKRVVRLTLVWVPIFLVAGLATGAIPLFADMFQDVFPYNRSSSICTPGMFGLHLFSYLFFYAAWEFHFRGFVQCGLSPRFGLAGALLVQVMASSLLHIGQPAIETFGAVAGGIIWGLWVYRSKSLMPSFLQHAALGIGLDFGLCFLR